MIEYKISSKAYVKMIFHAAKYPHLAVNGILLASEDTKKSFNIVDAIPLFHQCLYVSPMTEVALIQIESYASEHKLQIAGYYAASENFYDGSVEKVPAIKIADKINENYPNACLIVIDNKFLTLKSQKVAIKVHQSFENRWNRASFNLEEAENTLDAVSALLQRGAMKDVIDFDNYLDNPSKDYTNQYLNSDLKKLMAMY